MKRLLLGALAALVVLPLLGLLALAGWLVAIDGDLTAHRDIIGRQLGRELDREVRLVGEIRVTIAERPTLTVTDLSVGNAPWGQAPQLLRLRRLELQGELLPLLLGKLVLGRLLVQGAHLQLEVSPDGSRNWAFPGDASRVPDAIALPVLSRATPLDLRVEDSAIDYRDRVSGRKWTLRIDGGTVRSASWAAPVDISLESTWAGAPFRVRGTAGPVSTLAEGTAPYPIDLEGELLGIRYSVAGEVAPAQPAQLRLTLQAQADSLDLARTVFGDVVPADAPLKLALSVIGDGASAVAKLEGSAGAARANGKLNLDPGGARPRVGGRLELTEVDLRPWLTSPLEHRGDYGKSVRGRTSLAMLDALDAEVDLRARAISLPEGGVLDEFNGRIRLQQSRLTIEGLRVVAKPIELSGRIGVDTTQSPIGIAMALEAPRIDGSWLPNSVGGGELSGRAQLTMQGTDPGAWAQSAQGTVDARLRGTRGGDEIRIGLRRAGGSREPADVDVEGQWGGWPLRVTGTVGTPSQWLNPGGPVPLQIAVKMGEISANVSGKILDPLDTRGLALRVQADAPTLREVGMLWGAALPPKGPIALTTRVEGGPDSWNLPDLQGKFGPARAAGRLDLVAGDPRLRVEGNLTLSDVELESLLPPPDIVAAASKTGKAAPRLFSDAPLGFDGLAAFDAAIKLDGSRLDLSYMQLPTFTGSLRIDSGQLRVQLRGREDRKTPTVVTLDLGSGGPVPTVRLRVQDPGVEVAGILAGTAASELLTGGAALDLDLRGRGDSLAKVLASLDGHAQLLMGEGRVNTASLDRLVLGVRTLVARLVDTGRQTQRLECAVVQLKASEGILEGAALLETETSAFALDGKIDLGRETIDVAGTPLQKGLLRLATSVPVRVTGSLANPQAQVEKASTLFRLGMLLAKLNPATAAAAFGVSALEEIARGNPCVAKIKAAGQASR